MAQSIVILTLLKLNLMIKLIIWLEGFVACLLLAACHPSSVGFKKPVCEIEQVFVSADTLFLQARSGFLPDKKIITTSIYGFGAHAYGDLYALKYENNQWGKPELIKNLQRHEFQEGMLRAFGDVTPDWHAQSGTLLCTGKSFYFYLEDTKWKEWKDKRSDIEHLQDVAYAVYKPLTDEWSEMKVLDLPQKLDNGDDFYCVNAGCTQRYDLPDGDILLPIRYLKGSNYVSTVIRCSYDGEELKYIEHGSVLTVPQPRGLYEPSIACYNGTYFLTLRGDKTAYVATSKDGLHYGSLVEWTFDDGSWLGSYNTQQHWISHSSGLYLVYTRMGADNDQVFRHRAPLFMAKVDVGKLCVLKETECVLLPIPSENGDLGNFGVTQIGPDETWVTASSLPQRGRASNIQIAKIYWKH